jgi:hypothetical protein
MVPTAASVAYPPPLVGEALLHLREEHHARVVDQDVYPPELLDRPIDEGVGLPLVGHVAPHSDSLPAVPGDLFDEPVEALRAARPRDHRRALGGEGPHGGLADPARSPGYHRYLVVQPARHRHRLSLSRRTTINPLESTHTPDLVPGRRP